VPDAAPVADMIDLLTPELVVDRPPAGQDTSRYVRSYLIIRIFVGALGVALSTRSLHYPDSADAINAIPVSSTTMPPT
jgi:hypothetical protein